MASALPPVKSWYMRPCASRNDAPNVCVTDLKSVGKAGVTYTGRGKLANCLHLFDCQFCHAMRLAKLRRIDPSPFAIHIPHVINVFAEKQMGWIDTGAIVAMVADMIAIWNRAIVKFVGDAVRSQQLVVEPIFSISTIVDVSGPVPTNMGIRWRDVLPKAFGECTVSSAMPRQKACRLSFDPPAGGAGNGCKRSMLSATALAYAADIHRYLHLTARFVTHAKAVRLSFDISLARLRVSTQRSLVAASALTVAVGNICHILTSASNYITMTQECQRTAIHG